MLIAGSTGALTASLLTLLVQRALSIDAPRLASSPGYAYRGTFNPADTDYGVTGSITIRPSANGPASVSVLIADLPTSGGPFLYHIHTNPVARLPSGKLNCTATLAHLDPYGRGEDPVCNNSQTQTCQVGDLSGKHGPAPEGARSWRNNFTEDFISTWDQGSAAQKAAFVGNNRAVVVHFANKTRIACANLDRLDEYVAPANSSHSASASATVTSTKGPSSLPLVPIPNANGTVLPIGHPPAYTAPGSASILPLPTTASPAKTATQKPATPSASFPVQSTGGAAPAVTGATFKGSLMAGLGVAGAVALAF